MELCKVYNDKHVGRSRGLGVLKNGSYWEKGHFKPQLVSFSIKAETFNYSRTSRCVRSRDA